jgi:hypothetical protein
MNDDDFAELFKQLNGGQSSGSGTSWQDVRAELGALGRTLGVVFRAAIETPETEAALARLRELLHTATQEWNSSVEGTPEAQQARERLTSLADSLSAAAERAGEQVRPELLRLLRQANAELKRRSGLDQTE